MSEKQTLYCGECGEPANLKCANCKLVRYCNRKCQIANWPVHKEQCSSYSKLPKKKGFKRKESQNTLYNIYRKNKNDIMKHIKEPHCSMCASLDNLVQNNGVIYCKDCYKVQLYVRKNTDKLKDGDAFFF